jgi:hypothetical protein
MKTPASDNQADRERRLALAQQAFLDFKAQCFWSWDPDAPIEERHIPNIIEGLREFGGHKGYRIVAELCR